MIPPAQQPRAGVTVVIAQTSTKIGGGAERLRAIEAFVSERSPQADTPQTLLVLPELFMSGYAGTLRQPETAALADESHLPLICGIARAHGLWIVTGLARRRANGIANSAVAIRPDGQIVAEYDKICLFGAAEQEAFVAGRHIVIFDSPIGRTALAICFDVEQADLVDRIARAGATDLIVPTANMSPYHQVSEKTLPTRAKTAGIRIVYANHAGIDGELTMLGQSTIVTPRGETVTMLGNSPALSEIYMTPNPVDRSGTTSRPVDDPSLNP